MKHDASKHLVHINGELFPPDEAKISVFDSAVTLGDTMTESTRTFNHEPFKLERHIERLYKSLKVGRINPGLTSAGDDRHHSGGPAEEPFPRACQRGCLDRAQHLARRRGRWQPTPTQQRSPATVIIHTAPLILSDWAGFYTEGCHAVTPFSRAIPTQSLDARIKNRSRLAYTLAEAEVKLVDPAAQSVILGHRRQT